MPYSPSSVALAADPPPTGAAPTPSTVRRRARYRLVIFWILYLLFLLPLVVAVVHQFAGWNAQHHSKALLLPMLHAPGKEFIASLSAWLGVLVVVYIGFRVLGKKAGIKMHEKTLAKHKNDLVRLVYLGMTIAAVGGISTRIQEGVVNRETRLTFIPLMLAYLFVYTCLFELVKDRDVTLSPSLFENKVGMAIVFVGSLLVLATATALFLSAWSVSSEFFAMYMGVSGTVILAHIIMFIPCVPGVEEKSWLHLHHSYWSYPMAHACVFHTDVSMLAQAVLLAVHFHGVCCFGVEPIFYDTERRARHPSDFDWVLKEHAHERRPWDDRLRAEDEKFYASRAAPVAADIAANPANAAMNGVSDKSVDLMGAVADAAADAAADLVEETDAFLRRSVSRMKISRSSSSLNDLLPGGPVLSPVKSDDQV